MERDIAFGRERDFKVEKYEWDNLWMENADDTVTPRVLYIGDSISCGTRRLATEFAAGKLLFDGFGTSKALDNPYFKKSVEIFAAQQGTRRHVLFNNGLHGWHLADKTDYASLYEDMLVFLREKFPEARLWVLLTTAIRNPGQNARVDVRNEVALSIAGKLQIPVIDLHSVSVEHDDLHSEDGTHFTDAGYAELARAIVKSLEG